MFGLFPASSAVELCMLEIECSKNVALLVQFRLGPFESVRDKMGLCSSDLGLSQLMIGCAIWDCIYKVLY